ncbi:MAG TPA: hypothetical protein IAB25_02430 [Candidatus Coproplasma stercoravium]|nr:hypothetical protein [Candidatus Coproplasma stercoravium]
MKLRLKAQKRRVAAPRAVPAAQKTANKSSFYSPDDPDGSYTGVAADGSVPVQDADDL